MNVLIIVMMFILASISLIMLSRPFMYYVLKWKTENKLTKHNKKLTELHFSYEEMTYFVSLPNSTPLIKEAKREQLKAVPDFTSFIFPKVKGLKMQVQSEEDQILIAYISIDQFRLPFFDRLLHDKKMNERQYYEMSAYTLLHPNTKKLFLDEVYRQIHRNDSNLFDQYKVNI
ncbi:hypothetical protein LGQ02_08940 [Bacillus shivajii]|uniref:hypothetical protein n=1 Tax=Bacillus shivajii TaxID=1983719 RepID=UPI001CFA69C5|nr:hypothetical protein [Bacillus shivajii]UCZ54850.1 hypothetical protein LGQ02_08940 [Bacillus shivajii]